MTWVRVKSDLFTYPSSLNINIKCWAGVAGVARASESRIPLGSLLEQTFFGARKKIIAVQCFGDVKGSLATRIYRGNSCDNRTYGQTRRYYGGKVETNGDTERPNIENNRSNSNIQNRR